MCVMTHPSEYSVHLLMALKPAENGLFMYSSEFAEGELLRAQELILDGPLLSHWQSGHLSTVQLVQWTRAALDCEALFDGVDLLIEQMRAQHSDNAMLLRWTALVSQLVALRRTDADSATDVDDKGAGATDDEQAEP